MNKPILNFTLLVSMVSANAITMNRVNDENSLQAAEANADSKCR